MGMMILQRPPVALDVTDLDACCDPERDEFGCLCPLGQPMGQQATCRRTQSGCDLDHHAPNMGSMKEKIKSQEKSLFAPRSVHASE
ncbi:hypothetical protein [Faunimonas sp. B44]|uniref:hypothetical protein n=1 Tax=Faunimonas sp. B44 TaxID=3461493 RepID=UPI00404493B7